MPDEQGNLIPGDEGYIAPETPAVEITPEETVEETPIVEETKEDEQLPDEAQSHTDYVKSLISSSDVTAQYVRDNPGLGR